VADFNRPLGVAAETYKGSNAKARRKRNTGANNFKDFNI